MKVVVNICLALLIFIKVVNSTGTETFQNRSNNQTIKNEIKENLSGITAIHTDNSVNVWIGSNNSLFTLDADNLNKIFYRPGRISDKNYDTELAKGFIRDIYEDRTGIIWIASREGAIDQYDPNQDKFSDYYITLKPSGRRDYIKDIKRDATGMYWIATFGDGLLYVDKSGNIKKRYLSPMISSDTLNALLLDETGYLWIGGLQGIDVMNIHSENIQKRFRGGTDDLKYLKHPAIYKIIQDYKGFIWVLTQEGLNCINPQNNKFMYRKLCKNIQLKKIYDIFEDNHQNIILTGFNGVAFIDSSTLNISYLRNYKEGEKALSNSFVKSGIHEKNGIYWFGTENGLNIYNKNEGKIRVLTERDGLSSANIYFNIVKTDHEIWINSAC